VVFQRIYVWLAVRLRFVHEYNYHDSLQARLIEGTGHWYDKARATGSTDQINYFHWPIGCGE